MVFFKGVVRCFIQFKSTNIKFGCKYIIKMLKHDTDCEAKIIILNWWYRKKYMVVVAKINKFKYTKQ